MPWRRRFQPILRPLWQTWFAFSRRMTLGARVLVTDEQGRVLLIKQTYTHGWELPGGGVERGEVAGEAVVRELAEEAGVQALSEPRLISVHSQERTFKGDHVLLYRVDDYEACDPDNAGEIEAVGWFAPDALPDDTRPGSRRRIGEVLLGQPLDPYW